MTNEQEIKRLKLAMAVDDHLRATVHHKGARDILAAEIANTPSGRAHVVGTAKAPGAVELAQELWATRTGQQLRAILAQNEVAEANAYASERDRQLAAILAIENDAERINESRRTGIGMPGPRL
ncbi:hypothetical protein [Roseivivax sp. THAF30]|uniref:hypothetical protein n=1 Tax=Roseivivax sp. THAF30 TaxID=2587852 RepID=UPI0012684438|nr:hypothetical protein [Roseivivax sp. THAF30]QFT64573.1 hypothetical protein FIU91_16670 [Roseivivax sp. THAF30]